MTRRHIAAVTGSLIGLLFVTSLPLARAATFSVSPIRVELDASHRTVILAVNNSADAPLRMQVRPMLWSMTADGQWKLTPSNDLIVTPELLEVPPGKNVQMRVGSLLDAGASEASYRLLIDELPNLTKKQSAGLPEIRVLTQVSLPVFVEPAMPTRIAVLRSATLQKGVLEVGLGNAGTQRLDIQNVKVSVVDRTGHVVEQHEQIANYVLTGGTSFLRMKLPVNVCPYAASVSVSFTRMANTSPTRSITTGADACEGKVSSSL